MNPQFRYVKEPLPGELETIKKPALTKEELADMPRIIRKFEDMGLIRYKASTSTAHHGANDDK